MKEEIIGFIREAVDDDDLVITGLTDLIGDEIIDSLMIAQLIAFIEEKYTIRYIEPEDITEENFRTVDAITKLISRYMD